MLRKQLMRSTRQLLVSVTLIYIFCTVLSQAQWQQTSGPYGGVVQCYTVSGSNIFAGCYYGGVFMSTDTGASWTPKNNGLTTTIVTALASSGPNLFCGTPGDGAFISTDNGASWTAIN